MTGDTNSMREDLAFLRKLAEGGEGNWRTFARLYLLGGLIYGGELVLHALQGPGLLPQSGPIALAIGVVPTIVFIGLLIVIVTRPGASATGNAVSKSIGAMFGALGLSNFALIAVIGSVAWREHSITTWLIYPCTVFVLQGMAWLVSYTLRRIWWHALIATGWFATGIAMALSIQFLPAFVGFAGLGLFGFMALPGYLMLRQQRA